MDPIFNQLVNVLHYYSHAMFVMVLQNSGSTPRKSGANMIVTQDRFYGTIGGGQIEYQSILLARELLEKKQSHCHLYHLNDEQRNQIGMICGGDMLVAFQYLTVQDLSSLEIIKDYEAKNITCWYDLEINHDQFQYQITTQKDKRHQDFATYLKKESQHSFSLPIIQKGQVYILGGGHISRELAALLTHIHLQCCVIDNEERFLNPHDFIDVQTKVITFDKLSQNINLTEDDYVIIVTRGHEYDAICLAQVLKYNLKYIGMIGSKKKIAATYQKLSQENNYKEEDFQRVHAPIGLSIGAQTPEEIAIAIVAEIIKVRYENFVK